MDNPWCFLPEAQPFVLQADAAAVAAFDLKDTGALCEQQGVARRASDAQSGNPGSEGWRILLSALDAG